MTPDEQTFLHKVLLTFEDLTDRVVEKKALGATAFTVTAGPWTATLEYNGPVDFWAWDRTWGMWRHIDKYITMSLANGCDSIAFDDSPWHVSLDPDKVRT